VCAAVKKLVGMLIAVEVMDNDYILQEVAVISFPECSSSINTKWTIFKMCHYCIQ
jgi:hypothetical protein